MCVKRSYTFLHMYKKIIFFYKLYKIKIHANAQTIDITLQCTSHINNSLIIYIFTQKSDVR